MWQNVKKSTTGKRIKLHCTRDQDKTALQAMVLHMQHAYKVSHYTKSTPASGQFAVIAPEYKWCSIMNGQEGHKHTVS